MYLYRHLFGLYELIADDLIEADRFEAASFVIKNFIYKNIRNLATFRERIMRLDYIIDNPTQKMLHKRVVNEHRKR
jgi:hypothetical protein